MVKRAELVVKNGAFSAKSDVRSHLKSYSQGQRMSYPLPTMVACKNEKQFKNECCRSSTRCRSSASSPRHRKKKTRWRLLPRVPVASAPASRGYPANPNPHGLRRQSGASTPPSPESAVAKPYQGAAAAPLCQSKTSNRCHAVIKLYLLSHQSKNHAKMPIFQVERTGTEREYCRDNCSVQWTLPNPLCPHPIKPQTHQKWPK